MGPQTLKERLTSPEAVMRELELLLARDGRLAAVHAAAGTFGPRTAPPGFAGLARIVCGQQVSVASADAIWRRLAAKPGGTIPEGFLALGAEGLAGVGLSRAKFVTLTALAEAVVAGELDFSAIEALPADEAIRMMDENRLRNSVAIIAVAWLARHRESLRRRWLGQG